MKTGKKLIRVKHLGLDEWHRPTLKCIDYKNLLLKDISCGELTPYEGLTKEQYERHGITGNWCTAYEDDWGEPQSQIKENIVFEIVE